LFDFISICLNCASGAAPQQAVAAPDGAPDFSFIYSFISIQFTYALCAAPHQGVPALDGAPDF
jgi:hypothetical protein